MDATHIGKRPRAGKEEDDAGGGGEGRCGLLPWHNPAARICRVSRASGGKDRHSKVLTAKGLRDRRVRLSVSTAIQFYDLQDRLGYDQPSKAVEWLVRAASAAIEELPSLDGAFAELSSRLVSPKHAQEQRSRQNQHVSLTKSTCSSNSETSKGSVLSLSRSETRTKARGRAKERSAREKTERDDPQDHGVGAASHCSFTDLLTSSNLVTIAQADAGFAHRHSRAITTDYFGHDGQPQKPSQLPGIAQFTNGGIMPFGLAPLTAGDHAEIQHQLPFLQDYHVPVGAVANGGDNNLNFSISSGLAGFNRGTLQSNSRSLMAHFHHLQRFSSQADGSNLPFFFGAAVPAASASSWENLFPSGIDGRLHISYGDAYRHSDLKGKGKN